MEVFCLRRIIGYIYYYKNEGERLCKQGNMGFCRVELDNEKSKVTLCLKDGCGVEGSVHIYSLEEIINSCPQKTYKKTLLDKCYTACAGILNIKLIIDNCDGIYVQCGGRNYVALWKDNCEYIAIVQSKPDIDKDKTEEEIPKKESVKIKCKPDMGGKKYIEKDIRRREENQKQKVDNFTDFTRTYNRLCKIRMILEGVEYPVVKLKPHELMFLPRSCWRMANNIFLMESYYRYGHILFMYYDNRYVLAVPWRKDKNIADQAGRFGFTKSLMGYEYGRERDEKQYWLKYL